MARARNLTCALALLALLPLAVGGCAYYNTFYNAEQAAKEAERLGQDVDPRNQPTGGQRSAWQRAIAKCELVLDEYPDSDLVDDALFLMGKSYYGLREYRRALRNLDNVLVNFPNSEKREEALYLKSLAHLALGEEKRSQDSFALLRKDFPAGRFGVEAEFRLADAYAEAGRLEDALVYYDRFLAGDQGHPRRSSVLVRAAELHAELEQWEQAAAKLAEVDAEALPELEGFLARYERARALSALGRGEEAAALVAGLEEQAAALNRTPQLRVLQGRIQLELGEEEAGLATLAEVVEGEAADWAERARLVQSEYFLNRYGPGDERVLEALGEGAARRSNTATAKRLADRLQLIRSYQNLQARLAEGDSLGWRVAFRLGELSLTRLDRPRLALGYYRQSLELGPDSPLAPRAAYAIGWLYETHFDQPDSAGAAYFELANRYPGSVVARAMAGEQFTEARAPRGPGAGSGADRPGSSLGGTTAPPGAPPWWVRRTLRPGGPGAMTPREGAAAP